MEPTATRLTDSAASPLNAGVLSVLWDVVRRIRMFVEDWTLLNEHGKPHLLGLWDQVRRPGRHKHTAPLDASSNSVLHPRLPAVACSHACWRPSHHWTYFGPTRSHRAVPTPSSLSSSLWDQRAVPTPCFPASLPVGPPRRAYAVLPACLPVGPTQGVFTDAMTSAQLGRHVYPYSWLQARATNPTLSPTLIPTLTPTLTTRTRGCRRARRARGGTWAGRRPTRRPGRSPRCT